MPSPQWGVVGENDGFEEFPNDILGIPSGIEIYDLTSSYNVSSADLHAVYYNQIHTLYIFGQMAYNSVYSEHYIAFPCPLSDMGVTSNISGYLIVSFRASSPNVNGQYYSFTPSTGSMTISTKGAAAKVSIIGVFA